MSLIIHKGNKNNGSLLICDLSLSNSRLIDDPPSWLKQTDLYHEYLRKCREMKIEDDSTESSPHYHQQVHRKQRCNLHLYARSGQAWQALPSPPLKSPSANPRSKLRYHSNESLSKSANHSPIQTAMDVSTPLNISIKQDPIEENLNKSKPSKQHPTRRRQMLCKKKLPQNGLRRRQQRMNSVENHGKKETTSLLFGLIGIDNDEDLHILEPLEKKDLSSRSSSENDSNTSASSSIDHTSPSPTTTVSASSSHHSSPRECMRTNTSFSTTTRFSSPLRIQTSLSTDLQSNSTPQRRSARIWAPSNFYLNPMWIIPNTTPTSSKRLLVQNSSSPISTPSESNKRPRRRCRS